MRALGQAAKDPELINYATEFKLRCERRLGEMLEQDAPHGGDPATRQGRGGATLVDLGVSKDMSVRTRRVASVPEEKFEAVLAEAREEEKEITRRAIEKLLSAAEKKSTPPLPKGKYRVLYNKGGNYES